jgi:hypothetical protein
MKRSSGPARQPIFPCQFISNSTCTRSQRVQPEWACWPWRSRLSLKRYLGFGFKIHGHTHYGWARISMGSASGRLKAVLLGYAYETIAGKAIIAGATSGPDDAELTASFTMPIPEPATLGALAMGATGLSICGGRNRQTR